MSDLRRELHDLFDVKAQEAQVRPDSVHIVVRAARRRRVLTASGAGMLAGLVALGGLALARGSFPFAATDPAGTPSPTETRDETDVGPQGKTVIATGEHLGLHWTLKAYVENEKSVCVSLSWVGGGEGCGPRPTGGHHIYQSRGTSSDVPDDEIYGEVTRDVAHLEIALDSGENIEVDIHEAPESFPVNFFVTFVPSGAEGTITARDNDGNVLESQDLLAVDEPDFDGQGDGGGSGPRCGSDPATIVGTPGDDDLQGTPGQDVIVGLGGNDVIRGGDEIDFICGGDGDDVIDGEDGADQIVGGPGDDKMSGGADFDSIGYWDATGPVAIDLGAGTGVGEGTDEIHGFEDVYGSPYDDEIVGGPDADQIDGAAGDDRVFGAGGDDTLMSGPGSDHFDGGPGLDGLSYVWAEHAITLDLGVGTASGEGDDTISAIENIAGSLYDDSITGDDGDNRLSGREGNDLLFGGGGDDELWGEYIDETAERYRKGGLYIGRIDDRLDGGDGTDRLVGGPGRNECVNGEDVSDC